MNTLVISIINLGLYEEEGEIKREKEKGEREKKEREVDR